MSRGWAQRYKKLQPRPQLHIYDEFGLSFPLINGHCRAGLPVHYAQYVRLKQTSQFQIRGRWYRFVATTFDDDALVRISSWIDLAQGPVEGHLVIVVRIALENILRKRLCVSSHQHVSPNRNDGIIGAINYLMINELIVWH